MSARWIDIGEETIYGTAPAEMDKSLAYIDLDFTPDQGRLIDLESAYVMKPVSILGPFVGTGRVVQYARPHAIGYFLKWALGSVTTTQVGSSEMYQHEYTLDLSNIKSFTVQDNRELSDKALQYLGCLIKTLTLEAPARERVTLEAEIQYRWEKEADKSSMLTLDSIRPFVFHDASITSSGGLTVSNIEAFRFQIAHSRPDDIHEAGSRKLPEIYFESSEWTLEFDLKWKSWAARKNFWAAESSDTEPADEEKEFDVTITLTGAPTEITDKPNYELVISLPRCVVKENPASVSRRDRLTQRLVLEVLDDDNNKITLYNKDSAY